MIGDIHEGGVNMVDIDSKFKALKAAWVPRILENKSKSWCTLAKYYINKFGGNDLVFKMNFNSTCQFPALESIPKFYQDVVISYHCGKYYTKPCSQETLYKELLWGNNMFVFHTKASGKTVCRTLFNKYFIEAGILSVGDIFKDDVFDDSVYDRLADKGKQCFNTL